ncbi:interleukin-2 receptor subunit beta [Hyperolius riggenbachi]|uniref:interleukin-2 receptor subunit beta n=1 Tax=Hyperolius riggenbachi TaxID=752182 RepID=UPI0035A39126
MRLTNKPKKSLISGKECPWAGFSAGPVRMPVQDYMPIHLLLLLVIPSHVLLAHVLNCTYNDKGTVFCSWKANESLLSTPCKLSAKTIDWSARDISGSCSLSLYGGNPRSCGINLMYQGRYEKYPLTVSHRINISVNCDGRRTNQPVAFLRAFYAYGSVRLDPPTSLSIKKTTEGQWNLTWVNNVSTIIDKTESEICYKPIKASWQEGKIMFLREHELSVVMHDLPLGTAYEAKVRVRSVVDEPGEWSDWSQPIEWSTSEETVKDTDFVLVIGMPLLIIGIIIALITLIFNQKRVKNIWIGVPDPSQFFNPLITTHKGNFQNWISSPFSFSSFSLDATPPVISPLDVNWNKEGHHQKPLPEPIQDAQSEKSKHSESSFSNKSYFSHLYLNYDCIGQQDFTTMIANQSLPSPTEDMPLFQADYLCAPLSIPGLGFQNRCFELDSPLRNLAMPFVFEESMGKIVDPDEYLIAPPVMEKIVEKEGKEMDEASVEPPDSSSTIQLHSQNIQPPSNETNNNNTRDYLSLTELYQKHAVHWK